MKKESLRQVFYQAKESVNQLEITPIEPSELKIYCFFVGAGTAGGLALFPGTMSLKEAEEAFTPSSGTTSQIMADALVSSNAGPTSVIVPAAYGPITIYNPNANFIRYSLQLFSICDCK